MRSIVKYFILKVVFELGQMNLLGLASPTKQNLYEISDKMHKTNRVKLTAYLFSVTKHTIVEQLMNMQGQRRPVNTLLLSVENVNTG